MDPWAALGRAVAENERISGTVMIFHALQRIGLYGAIITTVVFLMGLALRWGDPRLQSEYKEKVMWKFLIVFLICTFTFFMGLIWNLAKKAGGYA